MDVGIDALRRQVREHTKQNQSQSHSQGQGQGQGLIVTPGGVQGGRRNIFPTSSAKKAFPSYPSNISSYPVTPGSGSGSGSGSGTRYDENPPMTPQSDRKQHISNPVITPSTMGYRSPGFGSGPSYVYGVTADLARAGSSSTSTSSQPVGAHVSRARKSAYMAQASPATKILSYGSSSGSGTPLPFRAVSGTSSTFGSPEGFKSPALSRNFSSPSPSVPLGLGRFDSTPVLSELSSAEVASYEEQLNSQQNILESASSSLAALEERVRSMRGQHRRS